MLLRTRTNGFTAWANIRLQSVGHEIMKNILQDFLKGCNLKMLLESMTGRTFKKLKTFDGLTLTQKETRIQWVVDELKACEIVDLNVEIDNNAVASKIAEAVFTLFWHMICYDIYFIWLRSDFLKQSDTEKLIKYPLCLTPPYSASGPDEVDMITILNAQQSRENLTSKQFATKRDAKMLSSLKFSKNMPNPQHCILNLINDHLQMTRDGKNLNSISSFKDLLDSRVLCALVNSIVPDTFTLQILLNDRWTINLAFQTMAEMSRCSSPFNAQDLVQVDAEAVCAYFTFFFSSGYKLRQAQAAIRRTDFLTVRCLKYKEALTKMSESEDTDMKKELQIEIDICKGEIAEIKGNYDLESCRSWLRDVNTAQQKAWSMISSAMSRKYELLTVPGNFTVKDLVCSMMINLSMTGGGFYELTCKENVSPERRIIVKNNTNGFYHDANKMHDGKKRRTARYLLNLSKHANHELMPSDFPDYTIFLESLTPNKKLKAGSLFLYKIFPDDLSPSQLLLSKAIQNGETDTVTKLVSYFHTEIERFLNSGFGNEDNTPLHIACKHGHFHIVLYLLEQNASINAQNRVGNTPLFLAAENGHKEICKLLVEWGANINIRNYADYTAMDMLRTREFRTLLDVNYKFWQRSVTAILAGKVQVVCDIVMKHEERGEQTLTNLRSRCINGSTLLHVASYYGIVSIMKKLLSMDLDVNVRDHKNATALHRARSVDVVEFLLDHNADIHSRDYDLNTPLHVRCYGEFGKATNVACVKMLVNKGIDICERNVKGLMPIHCAAIQGRIDAMEMLVALDEEDRIATALNAENQESPPSLVYLALANEHLQCAQWLISHHFYFKPAETDRLVEKILLDENHFENGASIVTFLYENGASPNAIYPGQNSSLHLAASRADMVDVLKICLQNKCDVNQQNDDFCTPLFFAVHSNNYHGAALLMRHGADPNLKNANGFTAFDFVRDFDWWISTNLFDEDTTNLLRAFSMKQTRQLIRVISQRVKDS